MKRNNPGNDFLGDALFPRRLLEAAISDSGLFSFIFFYHSLLTGPNPADIYAALFY